MELRFEHEQGLSQINKEHDREKRHLERANKKTVK